MKLGTTARWGCIWILALMCAGCGRPVEHSTSAVTPSQRELAPPDEKEDEDEGRPHVELVTPGQGPRRLLRLDGTVGDREEWLITFDQQFENLDGGPPILGQDDPTTTFLMDLVLEDVEGGERRYAFRVGHAAESQIFARGLLVVDERGRALDYGFEFVYLEDDGELVSVEPGGQPNAAVRSLMRPPGFIAPLPLEPVGLGAEWKATLLVPQGDAEIPVTNTHRLVAFRPDGAEIHVRASSHAPGAADVDEVSLRGEWTVSFVPTQVLPASEGTVVVEVGAPKPRGRGRLRISRTMSVRPIEQWWFGVLPETETLSFAPIGRPAWCKSLRGDRDGRFPHANGPARLVGACSAGKPVGHWTAFREDLKTKRLEGDFDAGIPVGRWTQWGADGAVLGSFELDAGTGTARRWWPNGRLRSEVGVRAGEAQGPYTSWHPDGALRMRGRFHEGRRDGHWEAFDSAGTRTSFASVDHGCRMALGVVEDSRAARGGLRDGDILVEVGKEPAATWEEVIAALADHGDGEVKLVVLRDGKRVSLKPTLDEGRLGIQLSCGQQTSVP